MDLQRDRFGHFCVMSSYLELGFMLQYMSFTALHCEMYLYTIKLNSNGLFLCFVTKNFNVSIHDPRIIVLKHNVNWLDEWMNK